MLDDYSVMGIGKNRHGIATDFLLGMCIPDVGFLFTLFSLENSNYAPMTYTASQQLDGSPDTYYGLIQINYPQGDKNAGLCVIRAIPMYMSSYELDNYIDEIALAQDMLENDQSGFVASYYNKLMSETAAIDSIKTIGKHSSVVRTQPVDVSLRRIETMLSKRT